MNNSEKTLSHIFQEWLELEANYKYQENTLLDYTKRYRKHINPKLGDIPIQIIDYKLLQRFFNENNHIGYVTNCKLKEILNLLLNFSLKCDYIKTNPISYVNVSGRNSHRTQDLICSDQTFENIIKELLQRPSYKRYGYVVALYIGKYTGMRISEVFALSKEDIDFENKWIYVRRKLVYAEKKKQEIYASNLMKTASSIAVLPLHQSLEIILKKWIAFHPYENLITDEKGVYLNPKQLEYTLWKISQNQNIHFHFHMLRHTFASNLVNCGVNIKVAQELLRHANINTTMNIYTHINQERKTEAIYTAFPVEHK